MDRVTLGKTLADNALQLKNKEAIIIALTEQSLLTCLSMAMKLHAWVYPMLTVPVYRQDGSGVLLGMYNQNEVFCLNPQLKKDDVKLLSPEDQLTIRGKQAYARSNILSRMQSYEMRLTKEVLRGRHVILACDVLTNPTPLVSALQLVSTSRPKSLAVVVGNATKEAAELVRISADETFVKDVLRAPIAVEDRYFQFADAYDDNQKHLLTKNIVTYWE